MGVNTEHKLVNFSTFAVFVSCAQFVGQCIGQTSWNVELLFKCL